MLLKVTKQLTCMKCAYCTCNRFQLQSSQHGNCLNAQGSCNEPHFLFALYYGCHIFVGVRVHTCQLLSNFQLQRLDRTALILPLQGSCCPVCVATTMTLCIYLGAYEPPEGSHITVIGDVFTN